MELPSMVERAGDRLVVRSLVSGATVYQTNMESSGKRSKPMAAHPLVDTEQLERQLQMLNSRSMGIVEGPPTGAAAAGGMPALPEPLDSRGEEELPQCKIRRNYSCNNCSFFTQNPRSHLSHLRDVHGEKIVINECKLCLYASRHFQKLVRHMKMVHGCSDDDNSGLAGRRHINREARKRRLEESIECPAVAATGGPTLKQLKSELHLLEQQLLHNVEAFNRQQQLQQLQQLVSRSGNIFSMAFEFQLCMLPPGRSSSQTPELEREVEPSSSDSEELPGQPEDNQAPEALDLTTDVTTATTYQCEKCSYSTPIRARFKKHVKYHSMPLIKCGSCDFHSPYKWNLDRHTKNHGANGFFKCNVCDFSTNIKQSLTIHELNHHVASRRSQVNEDQESMEQSEPQDQPENHETEPCGSPETDLPPISCSHCQQVVPNAMELVQHLQHCEPALRNTTNLACDVDLSAEEDFRGTDLSYCGVETAPGYGEVTDQLLSDESDALKKVFKCPHCTFWAATASRFHVHIVGHLNRKPFECSLCSYRSNWRWDITKHIRLKTMRDKSHVHAQVLMNDETGRRNYAKYNQYLTLMKVSAEQAADAKTMRCGEMQSNGNTMEQHMLAPTQPEEKEKPPTVLISALDLSVAVKSQLEQTEPIKATHSHKHKSKKRRRIAHE